MATQYKGLDALFEEIDQNKDLAKDAPAEGQKSTFKQAKTAPRIVLSVSLKLTTAIVFLVVLVTAVITYILSNQIQQVQRESMRTKGKIVASQLAKTVFEPMGRITDAKQALEVVGIEIEPNYKDNLNIEDLRYIRLYHKDHGLLWSGGVDNNSIDEATFPFYNDQLLKEGQKAPEVEKLLSSRPLTGLSPMENLINQLPFLRLKNNLFDVVAPVAFMGSVKKLGEVHIGISRERVNRQILKALQNIFFIAFGIMGASILLSILISLSTTRPIARLKNAMVKVGEGDLAQRVKISSNDEVGLLTWNFNNMIAEIEEKEKMRDSFGKAVSEEIVEVMMSGDLFLGGEEKQVTMLFSDIRSFTKISSTLSPSGVMEMLNEYFTRMEYVVNKNLGIIDKYVGDAIMAIFGATDSNQDHAENACRTAVEMILELEKLNKEREARGQVTLKIGVGINTGPVTAGMLGSANRMNYTVIGDTVNMASRLCDAGGSHGFAPIVIAEGTYERVKEIVKVRTGHSIMAKGKSRPIRIYELLGIADRKTTIELKLSRIDEAKSGGPG